MSGLAVRNVINWLDQWAPPELAEKWDRVGLQCGSAQSRVTGVVTALTLSPGVIDEAIKQNAELIVTHHPLIFDPVLSVSPDTRVGSLLYKLIQNNLALVVAHTNLDKAMGGVNDGLARRLQLVNTAPLIPDKLRSNRTYKLVTFLPKEAESDVRDALADAGAGVIGRYTHCAFTSEGIGSFRPADGANPYTGVVGQLSRVDEIRLETLVEGPNLKQALDALERAHPYEEVAVDVYPLEDLHPPRMGLGRIGDLQEEMDAKDFVAHVQRALDLSDCRVAGNADKKIKRVAVIGGSGGGFAHQARAASADALVTGDVDYHDADEAAHLGILLIDAGHFGTEKHVPYDMADYFAQKAQEAEVPLRVTVYRESDVFISGGVGVS